MLRYGPVALVLLLCPFVCQAAERYAAMFADGSRAEEAEVREWFEPNSAAKIGGRPLFDAATPVRWILDRNQPPVPKPAMYVEFAGGDRIAGEVIGFADGRENPYETRPAALIVKPVAEMLPPEVAVSAELKVSTEWLQRVVWEPVGSVELRPGTVWLRTGTSLSFRSLRWTANGVILLTGEGVKNLPLSDLGEVHLPRLNVWDAYCEQLASLSPQLKSRIVQLYGNDGSRWTTSLERFQARHHGDRNRPDQWYQLIQPAWSLESVWLRYRTIRAWRFFSPHEIPLTDLAPVATSHEAVFGQSWQWQTDQNAQRGPLQSQDHDFGWGFGVHGSSKLTFELPPPVIAIRTQFGLDRLSGIGGCVTAELLTGNGQSLLKQSNLIGSAFVGKVDWTEIPAGLPEHRRITLRTDMAHQGRPAGADPFDVRDIFNWYEPEIRVDPSALQAAVSARYLGRVAGLLGWTLSPQDSATLKLENIVDVHDNRDPQFRLVARSSDRFITLSRKVDIGARDRWLTVTASRFAENSSPTVMQVRIDGRVFGEFDLPLRQSLADPEPMLVPVQSFQGRSVNVELVVYPTDEKSWVDWRGMAVGRDRPGLLTLYEDDERIAELLNRGSGRVQVETDKPYSGKNSLKVTGGAAENPALPGIDALINEYTKVGQYRFIAFAWKKSTGSRIQIQLANQGRLDDGRQLLAGDRLTALYRRGLRRTQTSDERGQRFAYSFEEGAVSTETPFPLWLHGDLPREWQVIQRDLFGDFGVFSVTGLSLKCPDGDAARFDHIYLARTYADLEFAARLLVNPQPPPPGPAGNGITMFYAREDVAVEFSRIAPLFSSMEMSHGVGRQIEHRGQTDLVRTHANAADKPLILHAGVVLPADRPMLLNMHVSHDPECDWNLVVRANGEVLTEQLIDTKLTTPQRGWATVQVDLAKFAGQKVVLEIWNQSNNWANETAFWKRVELLPQ